jgi:hypothetical protein
VVAPTVQEVEELWDYFTPAQQVEVAELLTSYEAFKLRYKADPEGFICDCIEFTWRGTDYPADYQLDIVKTFYKRKRMAVRGPHGLGKTTIAAWLILWYALTRDGEDWKILTTASVWRQLIRYLWPEVHKWARRLKWHLIGREPFKGKELTSITLTLETGQAFALASHKAENLEGAHADKLFYLFDEAKIIPDDTFDAAEGAFSTEGLDEDKEVFAFAISTPGEPVGRFYDIHAKKPGYEDWEVRHVGMKEAVEANRISSKWCEQRALQWGVASAVYKNRVLGEFAATPVDSIIPLEWIEQANVRWLNWKDAGKPYVNFTGVGVDVGLGTATSDQTVFAMAYDKYKIDTLRKYGAAVDEDVATMEMAGRVAGILNSSDRAIAVIDYIGVGAGSVHRLNELGFKGRVRPFVASKATNALDQEGELGFVNIRSAAWWRTREMLAPDSGCEVALPPDDELTGDLTSLKKWVVSGGRIKVESKENAKKRIKRSPDCGDSVVEILNYDLIPKRIQSVYHGTV